MRLVDANLLVYAHVSSFPQHAIARLWLDDRLNAPEPLGLPWPSLLAFVRLVSNPRVFAQPQTIDAAWAKPVRGWHVRVSGSLNPPNGTTRSSTASSPVPAYARTMCPTRIWRRLRWNTDCCCARPTPVSHVSPASDLRTRSLDEFSLTSSAGQRDNFRRREICFIAKAVQGSDGRPLECGGAS